MGENANRVLSPQPGKATAFYSFVREMKHIKWNLTPVSRENRFLLQFLEKVI
jgi:hypothetical protein